ncbi:MAG: GntR family transcriptional regulator [Synergistaceae bacterium]|nr:GntR family transcriptional regulator [Synergistaceae bacterium]
MSTIPGHAEDTLKNMYVPPRVPNESARGYVVRVLRHNIVHLRLLPGTLVSANQLSQVMGVSRTPIREAIQELDNTGLMKIYPQFASQVSFIDYRKIHEANFIRMKLETAVIELACARSPDLDLDENPFEEAVQMQEYSLKSGNWTKFMEYDDAFHRQFYLLTGKMMSRQLVESVQDHFDRVRLLSIDASSCKRLVEEHRELLEAVKRGDKTTAGAITTSHLSRYLEDEKTIRSRYRDYFVET